MLALMPMHLLILAVISIPPELGNLILPVILLLVGALASYSFRWIEAAWLWLQRTKPIYRFALSGLWGGLAGWLTLVLSMQIPADLGQLDAAAWGKILAALATWGWHAFVKAKEKSAT